VTVTLQLSDNFLVQHKYYVTEKIYFTEIPITWNDY